jgi:hypothetical protein
MVEIRLCGLRWWCYWLGPWSWAAGISTAGAEKFVRIGNNGDEGRLHLSFTAQLWRHRG